MKLLAIAIFVLSTSSQAYLENSDADSFAGKSEMNGYRFETYKGFEKKWHLVTVRYREDTGELRFTYANPIAWKAMMSGQNKFPDNSIFAKIGYMTEDDPSFISSRVPSGARRFQFMIKDSKRHAKYDGWGYALFDSEGKTFPEDPKLKVESCHACHKLVPHRDYVFSQPMQPSEFLLSIRAKYKDNADKGFSFENIKAESLPPNIQDYLKSQEQIQNLVGPLRNAIFQGTLDEIIPTLVDQAKATQKPALLANEDFSRFTMVTKKKNLCPSGDGFEIVQTTLEADKTKKIKTRMFCPKK